MAAKQNIIEINGRQYDADSGQPIIRRGANNAARVIDGFRAPSKNKGTKPAAANPIQPAAKVHASTQKSQTLHRAAARQSAKADETPKPAAPILKPDHERLDRAKQHQRSSLISKFGAAATASQTQTVTAPVMAAPAPVVQVATPTVSATRPQAAVKTEPVKHKATKRTKKRGSWLPKPSLKRPKTAAIAATVASIVVLGAYFTYLNIPNMALRVAASRAGLDANIPSYHPTGFAFSGPVSYAKGQLTLGFDSNSDDHSYTITERSSNWDSQSLLDNYVAQAHDQYLTFQERGLTIYVYDNNHASWVDGGVWYTIEGNALLNTEQVLKIAASF